MPAEDRMDKHCDKYGSEGEPPRGFWSGLISIERRNEMDLIVFGVFYERVKGKEVLDVWNCSDIPHSSQ